MYINRHPTKKLLTKRILKTIDSNVRNPGEVEYDEQNSLHRQLIFLWTEECIVAIRGKPHFQFLGELGFFDVVGYFDCHIRLPQTFLH